MANKAQKRHAQKHKDELKAAQERMDNLDENGIRQLENYATFQILYINDVAYNLCLNLNQELSKIPYKSNGVRKVYDALMKRWKAYQEFINMTDMNMESVAELFSHMDSYIDERVDKFRNAIEAVLEQNNVQPSHWIASVETALTLCEYAEQFARDIIASLTKKSKRIAFLYPLVIKEPARVMKNMGDIVQQIHVKITLDLNTVPEIQAAFRQLNKAFVSANNFKQAQEAADEENIAEGRMTIM